MSGEQYFVEKKQKDDDAEHQVENISMEDLGVSAVGWFGNPEEREKKRKAREERKTKWRQWRIDKIDALTKKFYAVAAKRKWLVFMMALGIIIYVIITSGGGFSFVGILEKVKGIF